MRVNENIMFGFGLNLILDKKWGGGHFMSSGSNLAPHVMTLLCNDV